MIDLKLHCKILFHRIKSLHVFFNINTGLVYNIRTSLNEVAAHLKCLWDCLVATWCVIAQLLTTGSFVLDVNGPLQGTTHRSHLAGTAVAVAVRSAHWVGRLRAGLGALAHRLVVLDHAHCPMIARLIQAGARYAEIWRANTEETESKVRWGGGILNRVDGEREEYKVEVGERSGAWKGTGDREVG